ncbi:MAG: hypothetical protein E7182_01600 [Erysipelotrichaceae bacterium]|nr:hypothetical protein [Erysipelotrichaceae bacterium]
MKKSEANISSPEELNRHLQRTSPVTWVILASVAVSLLSLFLWSTLTILPLRAFGTAEVLDGEATLLVQVDDRPKIAVGQKVIISGKEGSITFVEGSSVMASVFDVADGEYPFCVIYREVRPIEFLFGNAQ